MSELGRMLIGIGLLLVVVGAVAVVAGKVGMPLGRLPGDFVFQGKHTTVYLPLGTSILISVALTVVFWVISKWR
jgi:hypothetical protein